MQGRIIGVDVHRSLCDAGQLLALAPEPLGEIVIAGPQRRRLEAAVGKVAARDAVQRGAECAVQRRLRALPR